MTWYIGIDPGQTGGLALVDPDGKLFDVERMPAIDNEVNGFDVSRLIRNWSRVPRNDHDVKIILEQVHAMPGQGVSSTFKFGKTFGIIIGCVQTLGVPLHRVTPQQWKKEFALIGKDKDASRQKATEMWPHLQGKWKFKKDNGLTDAALLAEYGRRNGL
jgi:crossover junction endodeoxyribonuclease RuvC